MKWAIYNLKTNRRYIPKAWATRAEAEFELWLVLDIYPEGHKWRRRLGVAPWKRKVPTSKSLEQCGCVGPLHVGQEG